MRIALIAVLIAAGCSGTSTTQPPRTTTTVSSTTNATSTTIAGGGACPATSSDREITGRLTAGVQMVSAQRGFAALARSVVGTLDGQHWKVLYRAAEDLAYVDATDAMHVWAVGTHALYVTSDGGAHWTAMPTRTSFDMVHFVNAALGWAVADGSLLESVDGGQTWQHASAPCPVDRVCFDDSLHGWIASRMSAYVTTDGGAHWSQALDVKDPTELNAIAIDVQCTPTNAAWILFDGNSPAAGSDSYAGYRCSPTGTCRVVIQNFLANAPAGTDGPGSTPGPFSVIDEHTAAFVGFTGPVDDPMSILIVTDDGRKRGPILRVPDGSPAQTSPQAVSFVSAERGWVVDGFIGQSHILATTDGGRTWTVQYRASIP